FQPSTHRQPLGRLIPVPAVLICQNHSTTSYSKPPKEPTSSGSVRKSEIAPAPHPFATSSVGGDRSQYGSPLRIIPPGWRLFARSSMVPATPPPIHVAPTQAATPAFSSAT